MKKNFITYLLTLFTIGLFAQTSKIVENPEHGLTSLPGSITKIELLDNETILHFHLNYIPYASIVIPKKSFLIDNKTEEKFFTTKAEGVKLGKSFKLSESGQIDYKMFFPKIPNGIESIDFKEGNNPRAWTVFDLILDSGYFSPISKKIKGNWYQTNGSKLCDYIFTHNNAIVNKQVWNYKSVKSKKNKYTILLENNGITKKIKIRTDDSEIITIEENGCKKETYSKKSIANTKYSFKNDYRFKAPIFKNDSATYSGIIKNYTPRIGLKTGTFYVNNVLTGGQESHLIKIKEDGSFSVKFPITHPQFILTRAFKNNKNVFVAPGKETFHVIDGKQNFFMSDLAQINTDLESLVDINLRSINSKLRKQILKLEPKTYKEKITDEYQQKLKELNAFTKAEFISKKALQIKKTDLEYSMLKSILSYEMYESSAIRRLKPKEKENHKEHKLGEDYLTFITSVVLNKKIGVFSSDYSSFINRLEYLPLLRPTSYTGILTQNDIITSLEDKGIVVSDDVKKAFNEQELLKNPEKEKRQADFNKVYGKSFYFFRKENKEQLKEIEKKNPNKDAFQILKSKLKEQGKLNPLNEDMLIALNQISTPKQKEQFNLFNKKYGDVIKGFNKKNKNEVNKVYREDYNNRSIEKRNKALGLDTCFVYDIISLNNTVKPLINDLIPYSKDELISKKQIINTPFLANYIDIEQNRTLEKLEANKTKTGYNINKIDKTEGDELFESIIAKFKGKVIYVDFWATWCAPCRSAMKRIAPLKEEMKDEDVVFLYISAPTSPEKTWNNSIPNIKGEHYRVTEDEWNYLGDKFKISGIPHYVLVNKKGEIVNPKLGHKRNPELKSILEKELKK